MVILMVQSRNLESSRKYYFGITICVSGIEKNKPFKKASGKYFGSEPFFPGKSENFLFFLTN